jgi:hypothetical protein
LSTPGSALNKFFIVRDEWEAKKGDIEAIYSEILNTPWTIEVNPYAIYAYAPQGNYAQEQPGAYLREYV